MPDLITNRKDFVIREQATLLEKDKVYLLWNMTYITTLIMDSWVWSDLAEIGGKLSSTLVNPSHIQKKF